MLARANARQEQQLRRTIDAATDDHLTPTMRRLQAASAAVLDADSAAVLDQDPGRVCLGPDHEVVAIARRLEIGGRRAAAPAGQGRGLVATDAVLAGAIEIGIGRNPRLDAGREHGLDEFVPERLITNIERAADAVKFAGAALLVFRLLEVGQDARVVPALAAPLAPAIIIAGRAPHVDQAVEGAGAAQHLAAGLIGGAVVEAGDRLALEFPIVAGVREELAIAERDMNPGIAVASASLEQQHPVGTDLREPGRNRTASRAGTRDDEIEAFHLHAAFRAR